MEVNDGSVSEESSVDGGMNTEGLGAYLKNVKPAAARPSAEIEDYIESLFDELGLPWSKEGFGWTIRADVGAVTAGVSDDGDLLTFFQPIHQLQKPPKKSGDYLAALLRVNMGTTGACFALDDDTAGGKDELVIVARIAAPDVDKGEIEAALGSLFRMSALFDD